MSTEDLYGLKLKPWNKTCPPSGSTWLASYLNLNSSKMNSSWYFIWYKKLLMILFIRRTNSWRSGNEYRKYIKQSCRQTISTQNKKRRSWRWRECFLRNWIRNKFTRFSSKNNGSQLKNPDISGALYTLRIQYSYTQTQCEDGARDVRVLQLTPVTILEGI